MTGVVLGRRKMADSTEVMGIVAEGVDGVVVMRFQRSDGRMV